MAGFDEEKFDDNDNTFDDQENSDNQEVVVDDDQENTNGNANNNDGDDDEKFTDDDLHDNQNEGNDDEGNANQNGGEETVGVYSSLAEVVLEELGIEFQKDFLKAESPEALADLIKNVIKANSEPEFASKEVEDLNKFIASGGKFQDFVKSINNELDIDSLDLTKLQNQKLVVEKFYKETTKFSDEKIERLIQRSIQDEDFEEELKEATAKLKEINASKIEAIVIQQKQAQENEIKRYKEIEEANKNLILTATEKELGFPLTQEDRMDLLDFIYKPDPKTGIPEYRKYLDQNPNAYISMAYLVRKNLLNEKNITKKSKEEIFKNIDSNMKKIQSPGLKQQPVTEKSNSKGEHDDFVMKKKK